MAKNRFQSGSGVYQCVECGGLTRDTGMGEAQVGMCAHCFEQAEWDNYISDGGDPDDVPVEFRREG